MKKLRKVETFYGRDAFNAAKGKYGDRMDTFFVLGGDMLAMEDEIIVYEIWAPPQEKTITIPTPLADAYIAHIAKHETNKDPENCPTCFFEEVNQ